MKMITDYQPVVDNIRAIIKKYIVESKLQSLIIGVSGGIDSALCAVLAKPVCDELHIPLIGRSITIETNKPEEISRSINVGNHFTHNFKEIDLTQQFQILALMIPEDAKTADKTQHDYKIRMGNLKARTRMLYLYDLAAANKGMVLTTDNYTELLLGFWTLHGDVGDYGMIQTLWKTEVYEMSRFLAKLMENQQAAQALLDCVEAVPTDGLGITNSDLDQIGAATYFEVDTILMKYLQNNNDETIKNHKVIQRHLNSEFKRNNPYYIPRNQIVPTE